MGDERIGTIYNRLGNVLLSNGFASQEEITCFIKGLEVVLKRWSSLDQYLEKLLVEDFMVPKQYATLLFDDENFTRSRKYFWAIGCLNEFISSKFEDLIKVGSTQRESLANLKTQFEGKLETVKALRDGVCQSTCKIQLHLLRHQPRADNRNQNWLANTSAPQLFNASALVESRASTRLGENVKLLTMTHANKPNQSLWAVPNIESKSTKIPFIITTIVIGAVTYFIVFNIDSLARQFPKTLFLIT
jgi:hypothetical protein